MTEQAAAAAPKPAQAHPITSDLVTVVNAEIGFVREDIDRLRHQLDETQQVREQTSKRLANYQRAVAQLTGEISELETKELAVKRILTARRTVLFDLEQEIS